MARKLHPPRSRFIFAILAFTFFLGVRFAAAKTEVPTLGLDEIVARMASMDSERDGKQQGYRGIRHYTVDYRGFPVNKHAEMVVQIVTNPQKKTFTILSETGSQLLLNRVLHKLLESEREADEGNNRREAKLTAENYNFQLVGTDNVQGRPCYVLQVDPKRKSKFVYKGKVWVDAQDFVITQISATPAKNPSFWISSVQIEHQYEKHRDLWLPRSNRSTSKVRLGGRALLTIDYQSYEFRGTSAAEANNASQNSSDSLKTGSKLP